MSPAIVSDMFLSGTEIITTLRKKNDFPLLSIQTEYHADEKLSYLDAKMWNSTSKELKPESSLRSFKEPIKL